MKAGSDVHRDGAQLRDGVGLREGELAIVGVDERDVERIVLRRDVGRRKRPGNGWTTQVQKRGAVMRDAVVVGVAVREDRRPVIGRDTVDGRIGRVGVIAVVGWRSWWIRCFWIWSLRLGWRIRGLGWIWRFRVWCRWRSGGIWNFRVRGCRWCVFGAWRLGRRGRRIILAWEFGWRGRGIVVTRKFRWSGGRAGIRAIVAGQLRRRGLRRDRDPIGDEIFGIDEPVIAVGIGWTSGGRRRATVAAGTRKKKRSIRCEAVGAVEPGAEAVLMIVATVALRKEAVLDAVDRVDAREHVTVGRIEVVGETVDVMVPAGFQKRR